MVTAAMKKMLAPWEKKGKREKKGTTQDEMVGWHH